MVMNRLDDLLDHRLDDLMNYCFGFGLVPCLLFVVTGN